MKAPKRITILTLLAAIVFTSCKKDELLEPIECATKYIYLGHTYYDNTTVDPRVVAMDLTSYNQRWLGGDLCAEATLTQSITQHIDDVFDLGHANTHWTWGNHDVRNGNLNYITDLTGRNSFYVDYFNGITLLVLNTNIAFMGGSVQDVQDQYDLITAVCDTVQESSHLIVLTHNMVWSPIDAGASLYSNADKSTMEFDPATSSTYANSVYPQLVLVEQRGVEVLHIAGDYGQKASVYEFLSPDGVQFIGSGFCSNTNYNNQFPTAGLPDYILEFTHDVPTEALSWEFLVLN